MRAANVAFLNVPGDYANLLMRLQLTILEPPQGGLLVVTLEDDTMK